MAKRHRNHEHARQLVATLNVYGKIYICMYVPYTSTYVHTRMCVYVNRCFLLFKQ